jgi:hypothetical protein
MFDEKSRYAKTQVYTLPDRKGRWVNVVAVPDAPRQSILGYHALQQGQRPDHLAYKYLGNAAGFWRIAELNNAMQAEVLTEKPEIAIPNK